MKKMNFVIVATFALAAILGIYGFTQTPTSNGGILTMRTTEMMNGLWDSSIIIVDEEGKVEKIDLKKLKMGDLSRNVIPINENLNKIRSKGYQLFSIEQGIQDGMVMTTYTFEKIL